MTGDEPEARDLFDLPPQGSLPTPGTGHNAGLPGMARRCADRGMDDQAIFDHISLDYERDPEDIWRAIRTVRGTGKPEGGKNGRVPPFDPELLRRFGRTTKAQIREGSPHAAPDLVTPGEVVCTLFDEGDVVCVQHSAREAGRLFVTFDGPADLSGAHFLNPATFREAGGVPNPLDGNKVSTRCNANVAERRYMVLERDSGDPAEVERFSSFALDMARFAPLAMAVDTGGKSVHFWFDMAGVAGGARERLFALACEHGADPRMEVLSQIARMPNTGPEKEGRGPQELLYWDPAGEKYHGADPRAFAAHLAGMGRAWPEPVPTGAWFADPPPLKPAVIGGLLRRGGKMVLGSAAKGRKTFTLLQLSQCLADGLDFLGMSTVKSKVLYLNMELDPAEMCQRGSAIRASLGASGDYLVLNLKGFAGDFALMVDRVVAACKKHGVGVVVLDPVYKVEGKRSENANDEVAELLNLFDEVVQRTGCAFVFAHHFAKGSQGGKFVEDRISGAGAWWRDPDAGIFMTPLEDENGFSIACQSRSFPPHDEFAARFEYPLMVPDDSLDPANLRTPGPKKKAAAPAVADLLPPGGLPRKEWAELAEAELKVARSTFDRRAAEAARAGLVEKRGERWVRLTGAEDLL